MKTCVFSIKYLPFSRDLFVVVLKIHVKYLTDITTSRSAQCLHCICNTPAAVVKAALGFDGARSFECLPPIFYQLCLLYYRAGRKKKSNK